MYKNLLLAKAWLAVFANDLDAFIPELWAQESLMILENNMVMGNLVHRDFEDVIANYGDVVNTRQPAKFEAKRKTDADNVTVQNATADNVPVPLNQHFHVSFMIKDGEQSKGFKNLITEYLAPAVLAMAEGIDQTLLGQVYRFRGTSAGKLGTDPTKTTVIAARTAMNTNLIPMSGRNMVCTPNTEGALLNIDAFINAEKVGDDGTALREGSLGRKFGMNFWMSQQAASIPTGNSTTTTALTNLEAAGATVLNVTAFATVGHPVGAYLTVAGDMTVQRITSIDPAAETITITPGLKYAVVNTAVVTIYTPGDVDLTAGYTAGYAKEIVTSVFTAAPNRNQLISFEAAASEYATINTPTTTGMELDIPLSVAVADADAVNIGPMGEFNFGFHRNALALVTRPLALPEEGLGARAFVASYNDLTIRVVITYNGNAQGTLVTVDLLAGVAVLNTALGMVMYG